MAKRKLTASEALFAFAGWLTTREKVTTMSSKHDAAPIAELVGEFCRVNDLAPPGVNFHKKIIQPKL